MQTENRIPEDPLLRNYVDKLKAVSASIRELQLEYKQLIEDAKLDGYNAEAIKQIIAVTTYGQKRGEKTIGDMVLYADQAGFDLGYRVMADGVEVQLRGRDAQDNLSELSRFQEWRPMFGEKVILFFQVLLGIAASGTFLWLMQ